MRGAVGKAGKEHGDLSLRLGMRLGGTVQLPELACTAERGMDGAVEKVELPGGRRIGGGQLGVPAGKEAVPADMGQQGNVVAGGEVGGGEQVDTELAGVGHGRLLSVK